METAAVIVIVIIGGLALLMFTNIGKDPSRKTTSMLERELVLHDRVIATTNVGTSEFQRRKTEQAEAILPEQASMSASEIRNVVSAGYEEGWRRAKSEGKDEKKALETALAAGLLNRLVGIDGWSAITPEMAQAMMMEVMPFKFAGSRDECRQALIEYAVWREKPSEADITLVQRSVTAMAEKMRTSSNTDLLASLRSVPMEWIKLLPDEKSTS